MDYIDIDEMYNYFKKIDIYNIYYKDRLYKRRIVIAILILLAILTFLSVFNFLGLRNILFGAAIVLFIIAVMLINHTIKEVSGIIKQELEIAVILKSKYGYIRIAKTMIFIRYLESIGIVNKEQKKILCELLYQRHKETKFGGFWLIGAFPLLLLPIWSKIIDIYLPNHMKTFNDFATFFGHMALLSLGILSLVGLLRGFFNQIVVDSMNSRSIRYKEMYNLIMIDILYDRSVKSYLGEITLKKID